MSFFEEILNYNYFLNNNFDTPKMIHFMAQRIYKKSPYDPTVARGQLIKNSTFDLPASSADGRLYEWLKNGDLHREYDLPALISGEGLFWFKNGKLHRENDLPAIIFTDGTKYWYINGSLYRRNNKPPVESNGQGFWMNKNNDKISIYGDNPMQLPPKLL